ncbi:MAG: dTMP kinase [Acidilobaceae archaeon]
MSKGLIIAFEGIDGAGLTTHSKLLVERLRRDGYKVGYSKEPTWGPIGYLIRELILGEDVDQDIMALLYAADRLWHVRHYSCLGVSLSKALSEGYIVVIDRYKYSSIAYQSLGSDPSWIDILNSKAPEPNIIVYIDITPEVAFRRVKERRVTYYYETVNRLSKIREQFSKALSLAESKGVYVIKIQGLNEMGKERSIESIHEEIYSRIIRFIRQL